MQERKDVTRVRVERRSCDQGRRKNDAFTLSARLPTSPFKAVLTLLVFFCVASSYYRYIRIFAQPNKFSFERYLRMDWLFCESLLLVSII